MQEFSFEYLSKIKKQINNIQKEVDELNKPSPLQELKEIFGGELYKDNMLLKINHFCSIEYNPILKDKYKLTTILYGVKDEKYCSKDELINILSKNL